MAIAGTLFQVLISVACVWLLGLWLDWPIARSMLVGFVFSLSSVYLTNTFLNAVVPGILGERWDSSLYAGALLSQIGEFSFD